MKLNMSEINLFAVNQRYIKNPYLSNFNEISNSITNDWLKNSIKKIVNGFNLDLDQDCEFGPYTGISGRGYALLRLAETNGFSKIEYITLCNQMLHHQCYHQQKPSKICKTRYLTGFFGLHVIRALALDKSCKPIDEIIFHTNEILQIILSSEYQNVEDYEIFNGRAGFLTGILLLRMNIGDKIISDESVRKVLDTIFKFGRDYSKKNSSFAKLMFRWHNSEYLGAAHGVSGIYYILFSFWNLLDDSEKSDLMQSVDWYLTLQSDEGNFPSSTRHIGEKNYDLIHWCHGAPGAIQMLLVAYNVLGNEKYLKSAEKCANLIWKKGILRKGPGICHGVAGNGYVFLLLYRVTFNVEYISKAKVFAAIMMNSNYQGLARTPDAPWSLFEGWAGSLCFLVDLLEPSQAQFPMMPINFK